MISVRSLNRLMINVTHSSMPDFLEYMDEIRPLWDTHWLTNMGIKHKTLEKMLCEYLDTPHVTLYVNGHLALENAIATFGFPKGGEVITTPFTFASTTHAIVRNGLVPVFCDIREDNYTIDADKIEELVTDKTVAILPVHVYGNICDIRKIGEVATKYDLKVIYDAAHAFGVRYKGVSPANFGDMSMFSFHATKVFNTIEGGAVCYAHADMAERLNDLKNFGIHGPESVQFVGGNAKFNEFCAAMGICNLRHVDEEIAKRKKADERYRENLKDHEGIKLCEIPEDIKHNYAYLPVVFSGKYDRDVVYAKLKANDIIARKYFFPLTNDYECYKNLETADSTFTPVAKYVADHVLTLPMYADLSAEDIDRICGIVLKAANN